MEYKVDKSEESIALIFDMPLVEQLDTNESKVQKKERCIINYFLNGNLSKTASQSKVSEATLRSWIAESTKEEINAYRIQAYKKIIDKTVSLVTKAITVQEAKLQDIANDPYLRRRVSLNELSQSMANNIKIISRFAAICGENNNTLTVDTNTKKLEDYI